MLLFILSEQFGRFLFAFFSAYHNLDTIESKISVEMGMRMRNREIENETRK